LDNIDGLTKTQLIPGNPQFAVVPTSKAAISKFARHTNATAPTCFNKTWMNMILASAFITVLKARQLR
jgi:hypothetical protein